MATPVAARAALVALLLLAAASAVLARGSQLGRQAPGEDPPEFVHTNSVSTDSLSYDPFDWFYGFPIPYNPEGGKKVKSTVCGDAPDAFYKLPELLPMQTKTLTVSVKAPASLGAARLLIFVDGGCTVFNGSAEVNQATLPYVVVPDGIKYPVIVRAPFAVDYWYYPPVDPPVPVRNGTFSADLSFLNLGTAPSDPGVKVAVYYSEDAIKDINLTECTHLGQVGVDLPKIAPGKTKTVTVTGLKAPDADWARLFTVIDASCTLKEKPSPLGWFWYYTAGQAGALLGGTTNKGQYTFSVKTTPKKPKVNSTMTVKVKIINLGDVDGPVGRVDVFASQTFGDTLLEFGGYYGGSRCNTTGSISSLKTSDLVIKAGKSKTVKIADVPAPGQAGWWSISVVPDAACANPADGLSPGMVAPYSTVEVVA
ncbi:hypothetical protein Rsub_12339 [Raphidocelis subcapitata]|uniref:CARDB domain-containing protein n=1 Tax=Raphidocelis subcapitata TaxID=307507 RepID=A0A2V0PI42_9CHLO|nr:hypothetical protein Rsub_12339 [Raphidocelis subcapitata]|eukprot:GBF99406.1 hypothetical protein Rsub_12339 [Raphidocelis subcapitata]